jgi:small subunit ribosomal protein S6
MNNYELALVVSAKLDDAAREAVVEKAKGYVTRYGGEISEVEEWGKKRLAYEIQHERDGYYFFVEFEAEPTAPAEIERHVRIMDNVLRYLIVRRDENGVETADEQSAPAAETEEAAPAEEAKEEN